MADTNLIRAGLPWSSPLKIIVDSSEVINDMTINRGLLNLLNNDYYLDLKTEAINNYIETNLADHINDKTIHFTIEEVLDVLGGSGNRSLQSNAYYKIPVMYLKASATSESYFPVETINAFINKLPKHLNGNILLIDLVYAKANNISLSSYTLPQDTIVSAFSEAITFKGFSNGTLLITTNTAISAALETSNIEETANIDLFSQSGESCAKRLKQIINEMNDLNLTRSTPFEFQGNGVNNYYSVLSINDTNADTYLYNCIVTNTLSAFTAEAINAAKSEKIQNSLPIISTDESKNEVLASYLCNEALSNSLTECNSLNKYCQKNPLNFKDTSLILKNPDQNNNIIQEVIDEIRWQRLNKKVQGLPCYFNIDDDKLLNNIETYIYGNNFSGSEISSMINIQNKNFSICFWGIYRGSDKLNENIPLFCDYSARTNTKFFKGIAVYANKIEAYTNINDNNIRPESYNAGYTTTNNVYSLANKKCFYVIDFVRNKVPSSVNRSCYTQEWEDKIVDQNLKDKHPYRNPNEVKSDYMTINVTIYDINKCIENTPSAFTAGEYVMFPNKELADSNFTPDNNWFFKKIDENFFKDPSNHKMSFFARQLKLISNTEISEIDGKENWDFYKGNMRNIFMFNKILSKNEVLSFMKKGVKSSYPFNNSSVEESIIDISTSSYIGALSLYNSNKVSLVSNTFNTTNKE